MKILEDRPMPVGVFARQFLRFLPATAFANLGRVPQYPDYINEWRIVRNDKEPDQEVVAWITGTREIKLLDPDSRELLVRAILDYEEAHPGEEIILRVELP